MLLPDWLKNYKKDQLGGDLIAGIIVAVVLVPQSMAYGLLAGLPPEVALYSSVLPLLLYALFGSSRALAVGPVGLMSLMTGATLVELEISNINDMVSTAHTLALLVGLILITMRFAKLGAVTNFLSHPVISGFVSASAIIIALSQLKHMLGVDIPRGLPVHDTLYYLTTQFSQSDLITSMLAVISLLLLWCFKVPVVTLLERNNLPLGFVQFVSKSGPLAAVAISTFSVSYWQLNELQQVSIIGNIPAGLPSLIVPNLTDRANRLFRERIHC